ncbi:hypothetical protein H072_10363 [Dactylellina haptotyla CBS 200.50]|uniref:NAD(P)-binding protein n=1 Tax=Dactylellina haptotyla (strain CBS 200.50) TaxID=1284197 RepID=S8A554_DACHA|nr:hypothetical protein H072_10363 [Dactylellina haptotyla CBS 200.50]
MLKYINKLQDKRVLVLGGTSGIGFCVAEACVEHGARVIVASSRQTNIDKTIQRIQTSYPEAGDRISGKTCDLSGDDMEDQIKSLYDFATDNNTNKLDHVVNTAGDSFKLVKLADATYEDAMKMGKVRYFGGLFLAKHASTYMNVSAESSFTNTSGVNSEKPGENFSAIIGFATAKEGMTRGLAKDMKPIRVNCVSPGAVQTELFSQFGDEATVKSIVEKFKALTLTGTIGTPENLAESYLYCMKNYFVTGRTLQAEGGYLLI